VYKRQATRYPTTGFISLFECNGISPIADAGNDTLLFTTSSCLVDYQLNGSGSVSPDGRQLTYKWYSASPYDSLTGALQSVALPPGNHEFRLIVKHLSGSSDTDTVQITVRDNIPPTPDQNTLPVIRSGCQVSITAVPTATDICSGVRNGSTSDPLSYNYQGTFIINWKYTDNSGNETIQQQTVIIRDTVPPIPDQVRLPDITASCQVTVIDTPTATDGCFGVIHATTSDTLTYSTQGTYTIHWKYRDDLGNETNQEQTVVIRDTVPPVPVVASLPDVTGECTVTVSDTPRAVDVCTGTIYGQTDDPLTYTQPGDYIVRWRLVHGHGNIAIQQQHVHVLDTLPPQPDLSDLPDIIGSCSISITGPSPTATDQCARIINGTTTDPMVYNSLGSFIITWVYDDHHGNISRQIQRVIVRDTVSPVPEITDLPVLRSECSVQLVLPFASDNCAGRITGGTDSPMLINRQGTHDIVWKYDDTHGNITTQHQTVIVKDSTAPRLTAIMDLSLIHISEPTRRS
jgi:hypothetical protein